MCQASGVCRVHHLNDLLIATQQPSQGASFGIDCDLFELFVPRYMKL